VNYLKVFWENNETESPSAAVGMMKIWRLLVLIHAK
jgi:hypothetical protein